MKQIQQLANDLHTLFFLKFVFLEQECNLGGMITGHIGIKNSNIKNALSRQSKHHQHEQLNSESKIHY